MVQESADGEREYVCDICGRHFESEQDLHDHVHDEGQLT